jgi:hypothetical protein
MRVKVIFWNKYVAMGIGLIVLGIFLTPIFIGFLIMTAGFLIGGFGVVVSIIRMIPGLEDLISKYKQMIIESYKPYFRKEVTKK